jgi:NAD(P)-dependent dehydrogenase (short-subunit alcohol dehydrogenase family)
MQASRIAVVTGANRGLGLELCRQLAKQDNIHVVLTARDSEAGQAAASQLAEGGLSVEAQPLDVTNQDSITAFSEWLHEHHGGLDILINNAGVSLRGFNLDIVRSTIDVNFYGPLRVTDTLLPQMGRNGRIVMVSSALASRSALRGQVKERFLEPLDRVTIVSMMEKFVFDVAADRLDAEGWPHSAYAVSKIGLNMVTAAFTRELAAAGDPRGILVNAICPGWVRTRLGGDNAPRSIEQGAAGLLWAALLAEGGPTGGFFRDQSPVDW